MNPKLLAMTPLEVRLKQVLSQRPADERAYDTVFHSPR